MPRGSRADSDELLSESDQDVGSDNSYVEWPVNEPTFDYAQKIHDNRTVNAISKPLRDAYRLISQEVQPIKYRPNYNGEEYAAITSAINRFEAHLYVEYQKIEAAFINTNIDITTHPSYAALVKQSQSIYQLAVGITGDKSYDEKSKAINEYQAKIGWITFGKEALKRAALILLGAVIGFVSCGLSLGAGAILGAAGAMLGNAVYRHGLFSAVPSFVGKKYGLAYLAQAFVDKQTPEPGVAGVVRRFLHKL